ncbi:DMT family transporter [Labedaea rhizosphaerae]|uniref:DMT family transporter n=1 Tax=Labedaea rhizosphaerae TaxID=598644 RepID=UPI001414D2CC|nr:EamA family transporter [Labedaea rhizosphaerae]
MPAFRVRHSTVCLSAAGICWGAGGVTGQALADATGLSAAVVAADRLGCGGGLLVLALALRRAPLPRHRVVWLRILAVAGLSAVFQTFYFAATAVGSVSTATLITIGSAPVFVAVAEAAMARTRPAAGVIRRVVVGVLGLVALVGVPSAGTSLAANLLAAAFAAAAGLAFALFTLLGRRPLAHVAQPTVTGYGFLVGGVLIAAVSAPFGTWHSLTFPVTALSAGLLVLLATVPTALAYSLFAVGLRDAPASTASILALLEPLTGTLLAIAVFGDTLSASQVLGALLLAGCVLDATLADQAAHRREK